MVIFNFFGWGLVLFFFFFLHFGKFLLKYQKLNSQQASNLIHLYIAGFFPSSQFADTLWYSLDFLHVIALKHQKLCVFGCPLVWCTSETAHSLWFWYLWYQLCGSDISMPWFSRKTVNLPIIFGIWITSMWILRCWETPNGCSRGWPSVLDLQNIEWRC